MFENIIAGRKIIDEYRVKKLDAPRKLADRYLLETNVKLANLGFNSIDDFFISNKKAVSEDFDRCARITSACDGCKGRKHACRQECYDWHTKKPRPPEEILAMFKSVTMAGIRQEKMASYFSIVPSGLRVKGKSHSVQDGCSITAEYAETPALDWSWK